MADGRVSRAGIGLTAVGPINLRARASEEALADSELDDEVISAAARLAAESSEPKSDLRGSAEYKRNVVRVFTERALREVAASMQGEG
jgi:carbon-monoxide dehydrogenase medium subunit